MIDGDLADRMRRMVGFRNVAIHAYQDLDLEIVRAILHHHLQDFIAFTGVVLRR